jgi:hypothetical protein
MKTFIFVLLILFLSVHLSWAMNAQIINLSGDVKIRKGVEEKWQIASKGMLLKEIDSILTGKIGKVTLKTDDGKIFELGSNAAIDIADLREISKQDLFLILMRVKVNKLEKRNGKTPLRIGNVSVVHGTSHDTMEVTSEPLRSESMDKIKNGIRALFNHQLYPNTIVKINKVDQMNGFTDDCGEFHFYLGESFESLDQTGQARDAYKMVLETVRKNECQQQSWAIKAREAMEKIK